MEGRAFAAHDSRQLRYRFPFGAVTEGERITLNIDCGADVRNAKLRIWTEGRERIEHGVRTDAGCLHRRTDGKGSRTVWDCGAGGTTGRRGVAGRGCGRTGSGSEKVIEKRKNLELAL